MRKTPFCMSGHILYLKMVDSTVHIFITIHLTVPYMSNAFEANSYMIYTLLLGSGPIVLKQAFTKNGSGHSNQLIEKLCAFLASSSVGHAHKVYLVDKIWHFSIV